MLHRGVKSKTKHLWQDLQDSKAELLILYPVNTRNMILSSIADWAVEMWIRGLGAPQIKILKTSSSVQLCQHLIRRLPITCIVVFITVIYNCKDLVSGVQLEILHCS